MGIDQEEWAFWDGAFHETAAVMKVIAADGNCLFRAIADQRLGDESQHAEARREVVAYMAATRDTWTKWVPAGERDAYLANMA